MGSNKFSNVQDELFKKDLGCSDPEIWNQFINDKERGLSAITRHLWNLLYDDPSNSDYIKLLISIYRDASNDRDLSEADLANIANQMHPR